MMSRRSGLSAPVSRLRRVVAIATTTAVVAAQAAAIVVVTAVAGPVSTASAIPGQPGNTSPGLVVYNEDFEARPNGSNNLITAYVGTGGERYTADPNWANYPACDGFVIDRTSTVATNECNGNTAAQSLIRNLASTLGQFQGQAANNANAAVASYTTINAGPGIVLKTVQPIPLASAGRFLTFSTLVAAQSCAVDVPGNGDPSYTFFLLNGSTKQRINATPLNPCTNPRYAPATNLTHVGKVTAPQPILWTAPTIGLEFDNGQTSGSGNDAAFDNIELVDVSPQLDKAFSPTTILTGGVSRLTFTVTNTDDLFAKPGWSFTDALPAGVRVAPTPGATTTCTGAAITAAAGGASVAVANGSLTAGQTSCTVGVNVTSTTGGAFTNGPSNVTSTGLLPPGSTTLTVVDTDFGDAPASYGTATASNTATPGLTIGATRDAEQAATPSAGATGDDTTGIDDEDGLTGTTTLRADQPMTITVPVTNTTGAGATIDAWVDFNRDGDFSDSGERSVAVAVPAGATSATLAFPAQAAAVSGASFIRLRILPGTANAPSATSPITGGEIEDHPATITIPSISLVKHAGTVVETTAPAGPSRGDTIAYTFDVRNTGDSPLTAITVTDPTAGTVTCAGADLAPGATVTCSADAVHTITQAEVDAGTVDNTATAASSDPAGDPVASPPSSTRTPVISTTGIALEKTARLADTNGNGKADIGEHIVYTFVVTNTGTKTLDTVVVNDPKVLAARLVITCPAGPLAPAASVTCVAQDWVVSSADIVSGGLIRNVATASARPLGQLRTLASPPSVADVPTPTPAALAFTGANVVVPVGIMLTLLAIGFALVLVQRRRKRGWRS
jgi:uncharacterized repeat protein (TIGR01451 family)